MLLIWLKDVMRRLAGTLDFSCILVCSKSFRGLFGLSKVCSYIVVINNKKMTSTGNTKAVCLYKYDLKDLLWFLTDFLIQILQRVGASSLSNCK